MIVMVCEGIQEIINQKSILVFDFDGVLADSVNIKANAFAELYSPYGSEIVERVVTHHLANGGMSRFDKFNYYHNVYLDHLHRQPRELRYVKHSHLQFSHHFW